MVKLNDETLMAYADGELNEADRKAVEAALADDPAAREDLRVFVQSADALRGAFDEALKVPPSEELLAMIREHQADTKRASSLGSLAGFFGDLMRPAPALAAGLALAVGLGSGVILTDSPMSDEPQPVLARIGDDAVLQEALERSPSGQMIDLASLDGSAQHTVLPLSSFMDRRGHFCREYEEVIVARGETHATFGVACRASDGAWRNEALMAHWLAVPGSNEKWVPAEGADISRLIDAMIDGAPMTAAEEANAIGRAWR